MQRSSHRLYLKLSHKIVELHACSHTLVRTCCIAFGHIIVVAQCAHCHVRDVTTANGLWQSKGRQKGSQLHHWGGFLHNHYIFESVHNGDHDSVVRSFVGISCELWGFFSYIILHYVEQFSNQECNYQSGYTNMMHRNYPWALIRCKPHSCRPSSFGNVSSNIQSSETLFIRIWPLTSERYTSDHCSAEIGWYASLWTGQPSIGGPSTLKFSLWEDWKNVTSDTQKLDKLCMPTTAC